MAYKAEIAVDVKGLKAVRTLESSLNKISGKISAINKISIGNSKAAKIEEKVAKSKEAQRVSMIQTRRVGDAVQRAADKGLQTEKALAAVKRAAKADAQGALKVSIEQRKIALEELKAQQQIAKVVKDKTLTGFGPKSPVFGRSTQMDSAGNTAAILQDPTTKVSPVQQALEKMEERSARNTKQAVINRKKSLSLGKDIVRIKKQEATQNARNLRSEQKQTSQAAERLKVQTANRLNASVTPRGDFSRLSDRQSRNVEGRRTFMNNPFGRMGIRPTRGFDAQSALISGGFPLLFGQGALGSIGGGLGGAVGGALGGGFGFGLSIAGTAIAQQIQQTLDFRKSIRELNKEMEQMGISSNISGSQVRQLGKSLGITKEEAVKALQEFKRFGNDAVLIAKKFGGDFGRFDALAQANTVESALSAIRKINKDLTLEDELRFILSVQRKGVEATINDILTETLEKQKELDTAGFGQGVGGRKRPAVLKREKEQLNEINTENTQLIEKLTNIRDLNNEIRIANEESSFSIVKGLQDVNAEIRKLNSAQFQVVELSKTLGSAFSESFKGIIKGTMSVGEAFRSMFMRIADHFLDMAARMMAAQISRGFMGLFANAFGGGFSILGGATNTSLSTAQQVAADTALYNSLGSVNTFPAGSFANGGYAQRNKSYIVGERGPELFTPGASGGQVSPMGSTNIVVNVDASGSSVEGDEEQGRELGRMISVAIQSELIKQKRPGGMLA